MKTRRNVYIILGCILLILNLWLDLVELSEHTPASPYQGFTIGGFIGSHIFIIFGLIFLRLAYKLHKRIRAKEESELDDIENIGKNN